MIVDCDQTVINSMLPDTSLTLGFRFRGSTKYLTDTENPLPFAVVAGLRKSIQFMKDESDTANLLVIFQTAGATAFFKEPLHETCGEVVSLKEFSNFKSLNKLEDGLSGAITNQQRIQLIEQFLLERLVDHKPDPLIANAVHQIKLQNGVLKIKDLAAAHYISLDAFEKRFRRFVGSSPKLFAYIVRMNSVIGNIHQQDLFQTAFDAGYYDQSHFNKDFKTFTGQTPSEFLKKPFD